VPKRRRAGLHAQSIWADGCDERRHHRVVALEVRPERAPRRLGGPAQCWHSVHQ
jgi:hypothetical protein